MLPRSRYAPFNTRGVGVPQLEVDGMTSEEAGDLFDRLELQCLQPEFRYNHLHTPGDVTIWDNLMTLHAVPPIKSDVRCDSRSF